jgi:hypothetical protein
MFDRELVIAQNELERKLLDLDIKSLDVSEYTKHYLGFMQSDLSETLSRFRQVLEVALDKIDKPLNEISIVDYGGGVGLLSMLAKQMGISNVFFNDIYPGSCTDAKTLALRCNLTLDDYICGDASEVVEFIDQLGLGVDAIVSYDVIEHVYDVELNFSTFSTLRTLPKVIVYGSGANIYNPWYVKQVRKKQLAVENTNRIAEEGHKDRDSTESYFEIRKNFIGAERPDLNPTEILDLSSKTRGLVLLDIRKYLAEQKTTGNFNYLPSHPTNTCDP